MSLAKVAFHFGSSGAFLVFVLASCLGFASGFGSGLGAGAGSGSGGAGKGGGGSASAAAPACPAKAGSSHALRRGPLARSQSLPT